MSLEKKETFGIISNLRPSPYYEETGIPIAPRKRECIGEDCPLVLKHGRCFEDEHHLLFTAAYYSSIGGVYAELQADPFMRIRMARCRHNSDYGHAMHSQFDFTPLPAREAAYGFLDESRLLRRMGSTVSVISGQVSLYFSSNLKSLYQANLHKNVIESAAEIERQKSVYDYCAKKVEGLEVVPSRIFGNYLHYLSERRRALQDRVLDDRCPDAIRNAVIGGTLIDMRD